MNGLRMKSLSPVRHILPDIAAHILRSLCVLVIGFVTGAVCCYSQNAVSTGSLAGTLQDSSGAALPGVTITLTNETTGSRLTTQSNSQGIYIFPGLGVGVYQAAFTLERFKSRQMDGLKISVGQTTNADVAMQLGDMRETVAVSANEVLNTADPSPSVVIENSTIEGLPLSGRRYTDFVLLTPNVTTDGEFGHISFAGQQGGYLSGYANANGSSAFTVDGANASSVYYGDARGFTRIPYVFGLQAVQEFQVAPNVYSAVYGGAGAGFVNTVTKSGTKDYHGDAFYYNRNSATGANDAVNKASGYPRPVNNLQQFGADLGGPLKKGKLFFYFDYEQQRQKQPLYIAGTIQSTVTEVDFGVPAGTTLPVANSHFPSASTLTPAQASANPLNPIYLQGVSNALNEIRTNSGARARRRDDIEFFPKIDWIPTDKDRITLLYNYNRFQSPGGVVTTSPVAFAGIEALGDNGVRDHVASMHWVRTLNSVAVNDAHISFVRDEQLFSPTGLVDPNAPLVQLIQPQYFALGNETFSYNNLREYQWELADHITYIHGKHEVEVGFDYNRTRVASNDPGTFHGQYLFLTLQDFALGKWDIYGQTNGDPRFGFTVPFVGFYANDVARVRRNLTLNIGVREDFQIYPNPAGNPALPFSTQFHNEYQRVAPRFGFAYEPFSKTVVRGGAGLYYALLSGINYQNSTQANGLNQASLQITDIGNANVVPLQQALVFPNALSSNDPRFANATNIVVIAPGFRSPSAINASLQIEREVANRTKVTAGSVWTHGVHLTASTAYDMNLIPQTGTTTYVVCPANTAPAANTCNGPSYTGPNLDSGRLQEGLVTPKLGQINALISPGVNNYVSFFTQITRQVADGFTVLMAYTLSKTTQSGVDFYNQFDLKDTHSLALQDQRHRLSVATIWKPTHKFANPVAKAIFSNWSMSMLSQFNSGHPYTGLLNPATNGGSLNDSAARQSTQNTSAGLGGRGPAPDAGLNTFTGPWITQVDLGLQRKFRLADRHDITIKVQAFNVLNATNYFVQAGNGINDYQYDAKGSNCGDGKTANQTCYLTRAAGFNTLQSISQPNGPRIFQFAMMYGF